MTNNECGSPFRCHKYKTIGEERAGNPGEKETLECQVCKRKVKIWWEKNDWGERLMEEWL